MKIDFDFKIWIYCIIIGSIVGILAETAAYLFQLWIFTPWWFFIPWGIIWEGLLFGSLAFFIRKIHLIGQYGISAIAGCIGEIISIYIYPIWVFPGNNLLFLHGPIAIIISLSIIWGFFSPAMTIVLKLIRKEEKNK